ncbi:universal stress protein [Hydrogenophaga sp.]|uniref:universal stress protein n=1 Tax=Hydrogenophaga sp. TaxID=1904254 RepID=UPI0026306C79|nr:universal stress protein [Hydrogenophaga sp.]MCW5654382.1 universal stress protein [Hydrogenophaga sp.]
MSSLRSILLHLDNTARAADRTRLARSLAEAFDAHVVGQPCTLSALTRFAYALQGAGQIVEVLEAMDREGRDRMHAGFAAVAAGSSRMHWSEPLPDAPWSFARRALYADLMILGQRDPKDPADAELPADFLPSLLIESGRPALILPSANSVDTVGQTVLVAWKETRESARAVTAALPWLRRARAVHLLGYGDAVQDSLDALKGFLQTHGIVAMAHAGGPEPDEAGNPLLSAAADLGADLLVMGCYGHSRAREWVLGGATRTVLGSMTLPVLMVH